jgi:hypothetical protein
MYYFKGVPKRIKSIGVLCVFGRKILYEIKGTFKRRLERGT